MRLLPSSVLLPLAFLSGALLLLAIPTQSGCSSNEGGGGSTPEAGDGKYHPPGNGQHQTEALACDALLQAQQGKALALQCSATTRPCPELLRAAFTTQCMEYDQGSVQGCVDHYNEATTCDDLAAKIDDCVITPFPGTEPAGCPGT